MIKHPVGGKRIKKSNYVQGEMFINLNILERKVNSPTFFTDILDIYMFLPLPSLV